MSRPETEAPLQPADHFNHLRTNNNMPGSNPQSRATWQRPVGGRFQAAWPVLEPSRRRRTARWRPFDATTAGIRSSRTSKAKIHQKTETHPFLSRSIIFFLTLHRANETLVVNSSHQRVWICSSIGNQLLESRAIFEWAKEFYV